jgi:Ohr subfamily peroxiredoxin
VAVAAAKERIVSPPETAGTAEAPGKVIYTAKVHTTGGRTHGVARSSDGRLDVILSLPGAAGTGTNPEQLFAAGWSACFESAIGFAAVRRKIAVPEVAIDAEIDLHLANSEYFISARFNVSLPGVDRDVAKTLIAEAEKICTYTKATRGNVDTVFNLI